MKIYDCFTYFNEDQLLKLRLETLWDKVDFFVICEATRTHSGNDKPINFKSENFKKYKEKIRYLLVDTFPFESNNPWVLENYQRNYLANGLFDAEKNDLILISDLDEIPNPNSINKFNPKKFTRGSFHQFTFIYFLNNCMMKNSLPLIWSSAMITTYGNLVDVFKCPNEVRTYRGKGIFRGIKKLIMRYKTQAIEDGGWHFTWTGGVEKILLKMESTAHQEFNLPEYRDPELIKQKIRVGGDILGEHMAGSSCQLLELDEKFPEHLVKNVDEFSNLILRAD
jgi:beta-1,4-mannosyl-glycoprotein beta-1,4-N-acetylglucosaminyltransferase